MGYMTLFAICPCCEMPFSCNPHTVSAYKGQPICEACITAANAKREELGLPKFPILEGAYEPAEEG